MSVKLSSATYRLDSCPSILSFAAVVGKKEGEGPLAGCFDRIHEDTTLGERSWEKAESRLQQDAVFTALSKADLSPSAVDLLFAGDLLNQCIGSSYGLRDLGIPFCGLYGACSTMAESLALASIFADNGLCNHALAVTSSHFCSAERQFRYPLDYGGQRTPTAQWTVTGSGAALVGTSAQPPYVKAVTLGQIVDLGVQDINNMGAAMAPAAAHTLKRYFTDTGTSPANYDLIVTGDLGSVGSVLLLELMEQEGYSLADNHTDCGVLIYNAKKQDVHAGGSGCGCSASVLCGHLLPQVREGQIKDLLFVATGALMSPTSVWQGESIPAVAHLVHISNKTW